MADDTRSKRYLVMNEAWEWHNKTNYCLPNGSCEGPTTIKEASKVSKDSFNREGTISTLLLK